MKVTIPDLCARTRAQDRRQRASRRGGRLLTISAAALLAAGCTVPVRGDDSTPQPPASTVSALPTVAAAPAGTLVVTVPGFSDTTPAASVSPPAPAAATTLDPATAAPATAVSTGVAPTTAVVPATVTPTTVAPTTPVVAATPPAAGPTVSVTVAGCQDCVVLATRAQVQNGLSAALITTSAGRAALISLRSDGAVAGVAAMIYGATFRTPGGGALPCDSGGRCLVTATTSDGLGIGSSFQLTANGSWQDMTPPGGFASSSAAVQVIDLDGEPGIAVMESAGGASAWTVYAWTSAEYAVIGCQTGSGTLNVAALDLTQCLS